MIERFFLVAAIGFAAVPAQAQHADPRAILRELGMDLDEKQMAEAIEKASSRPLGSKDNPVRAYRPEGQRAYLARLRCADGKAPAFERVGGVGPGPFASIVDAYAVRCGEAKAIEIYMDMYHDHIETRAVDGFTMAENAAGPTT